MIPTLLEASEEDLLFCWVAIQLSSNYEQNRTFESRELFGFTIEQSSRRSGRVELQISRYFEKRIIVQYVDGYRDDANVCSEPEENYTKKCFECLGEVDISLKTVNQSSPIRNALRRNSFHSRRSSVQGTVELFGKKWDRGSVLHSRMGDLFKMAMKEIVKLKSASINPNSCSIKFASNSCHITRRKMCSDLFSFLEEYFSIASTDTNYLWCFEELLPSLCLNFNWFLRHLGHISSLPESVTIFATCPNVRRRELATHNLFHLHLDVRWMHLNLILLLHKSLKNHQLLGSQAIENANISASDLTRNANDLLGDLIDLAFLKFAKMAENDCRKISPFHCTCVQEVWLYLHNFYSILDEENGPENFWRSFCTYVGKICSCFDDFECQRQSVYIESSLSRKTVFAFCLITNLSRMHKSMGVNLQSSHVFLENLLKNLVSPDEANDLDVKAILVYIEELYIDLWEPRVEPIVILWEYYYKKINSRFYDPSSSIDSIATLSKSARGLLRHVKSFLDESRAPVLSSYQNFLRIVGLHLRKTSNTPRHWNVIKGRIYSKMSGSKLGSLTQIGEHHVVLLFTMLACAVGVGQVETKFNDVLSTVKRIKGTLSAELIQGQMAMIILSINERRDVAQAVQVLIEHVNSLSPLDDFDLLKRFTEEVQEILRTDGPLGLGLHLLVDSWVASYLACCSPTESGRLIESIAAAVDRLKFDSGFNSPDQETILFVERVWQHLQPYFQGLNSHVPIQSADLAASLVSLFISTNDHDRAALLINQFVAKDCGDVWLSRKFLVRLIQNNSAVSLLARYNKTIIKAWIKCCILCSDTFSFEMKILTGYVGNLKEISSVCSSDSGFGLTDAKEPLQFLCSAFSTKFASSEDIYEKQNLREKLVAYLDGVHRWLKPNNLSQDHEVASNLFKALGDVLRLCAPLIYTKSKPNTVLQQIFDTFLLPPTVRNPDYKLPTVVVQVIKECLHLFIEGLYSLYSKQDTYIVRILRELLTVYIPRCITLASPLPMPRAGNFTLVSKISAYDCNLRCLIFDMVTSQFLKKKSKIPHHHACHALKFLKDILLVNDRNADVMQCIIKSCFERICDVVMFCDEKSAATSHSKDILKAMLNSDILREQSHLMDSLSSSLAALSTENLAWSSRQMFDLVVFISNVAPDLVVRFLPLLLDAVKHVEMKRGVGYDKNLRFGLERVESNLRSIKSTKESL